MSTIQSTGKKNPMATIHASVVSSTGPTAPRRRGPSTRSGAVAVVGVSSIVAAISSHAP